MTRDDHHRRAVVLSLGCPQGAHFLFFSFILKPENSVPKKYGCLVAERDPDFLMMAAMQAGAVLGS